MIIDNAPVSDRLELKSMSVDRIHSAYVDWLNDIETKQFLASGNQTHTIDSVTAYVDFMATSTDNYLFGIYLKSENRHIGTIRLGPVEVNPKMAPIGLLIGDASCRGKGIGTESIKLVSDFAFNRLHLLKVFAGYYAQNIASSSAFAKAGFTAEPGLNDRYGSADSPYDLIFVSKLRSSQ